MNIFDNMRSLFRTGETVDGNSSASVVIENPEIVAVNTKQLDTLVKRDKMLMRQFDAAVPSRLNASWIGASKSINTEIKFGLQRLRDISRDLAQNDPIIKKYLRTLRKYVVGPEGPTLKVKSFDRVKDEATGEWVKQFDTFANQQIEEAWTNFCNKKNLTVRGTSSFRQMLNIILYNTRVDGEIFIRKIYDKKYAYGVKLQLIEASLCPETLNATTRDGNLIVMGIELDKYLAPVAYWFREKPYGADIQLQYYSNEYLRVPADEIIHYFNEEWANQLRGYPEIVAVANRLRQLKGYEEAALFNARSGATKTMVLEYDNTGLGELTNANIAGAQEQADGSIQTELQIGQIYVVPKGMKKADWDPAYPQGEHGNFVKHQLKIAASGLDIDYPTLSGDLEGVNYTSSRHGMLDSRYGYKAEQANLREDVIIPIYEVFLMWGMLTGKINLPLAKYDKFIKVKVIGFTPEWVDPLKDGKATNEALANLTESYEDVLAEKGKDLDEFAVQLSHEKKLFERLGLKPDMTKQPITQSESI